MDAHRIHEPRVSKSPSDTLNAGAGAGTPPRCHSRRYLSRHLPNGILEVAAASPEYLLAMKLLSARAEQDVEDIRILYELCGLRTSDQGLALVGRLYPGRILEPKTRPILEELCGPAERETEGLSGEANREP